MIKAEDQDIMIENIGVLFDPEIVKIFLAMLRAQNATVNPILIPQQIKREIHFNQIEI